MVAACSSPAFPIDYLSKRMAYYVDSLVRGAAWHAANFRWSTDEPARDKAQYDNAHARLRGLRILSQAAVDAIAWMAWNSAWAATDALSDKQPSSQNNWEKVRQHQS